LAHFFGASSQTDAFNTAFLIPDFIFNLFIAGALSGVLMPSLVNAEKKSPQKAVDLFASFLSIMNLLVSLISLLCFFITPFLINKIFASNDIEQKKLIIDLTRILLLSPIFFGLSNTFGSLLLAKKRFFSLALAPIFYNIGILLGMIFFAKKFGIFATAWGAALGVFLHFLLRWIDFRNLNFPLKFSLDYKNKDFLKVLILAFPKTIGMMSFQGMLWGFNLICYRFFKDGALSAFAYARNLQSFSVSLFGIALATAVFPFLAEFSSKKNYQKFTNRLEKSSRQILFLALPASVGIFLLAEDIVEVIFSHGNFSQSSAQLTTNILRLMAISIPFESLTHLFARAFLACRNTIIPMIGQIIFFTLSVGSAFYLSFKSDAAILGLSFSIAALLQCVFLIITFHQKISSFPFKVFLVNLTPTILLTFLMTIFIKILFLVTADYYIFWRLFLIIFLSAIFFFTSAFILKMPEISRVRSFIANKLFFKK